MIPDPSWIRCTRASEKLFKTSDPTCHKVSTRPTCDLTSHCTAHTHADTHTHNACSSCLLKPNKPCLNWTCTESFQQEPRNALSNPIMSTLLRIFLAWLDADSRWLSEFSIIAAKSSISAHGQYYLPLVQLGGPLHVVRNKLRLGWPPMSPPNEQQTTSNIVRCSYGFLTHLFCDPPS